MLLLILFFMTYLDPNVEDIASGMRRVSSWTRQQKLIIFENTIEYVIRNELVLPDLVKIIQDYDAKFNLAHDRYFCQILRIPYHLVDEYWDDLRASIALFYYEQLSI